MTIRKYPGFRIVTLNGRIYVGSPATVRRMLKASRGWV